MLSCGQVRPLSALQGGHARIFSHPHMIPGIGRVRFGRLLEFFGDVERAWHADLAELIAAGLDRRSASTIVTRRPKIELDAAMDRLDRYNVKVLTQDDSPFPQRLKEIYDAPLVLYVRKANTGR